MKLSFYPKLAIDGMRKNKRLYIPYILTGSVMVMMFYILGYLVESPALANMPGGSVLPVLLEMGVGIIGFFSLLFLFYTNSFLIRQRYREFGLYNVLGMDKRNISKIMIWECLFVGLAAVFSGMLLGVALSKAAELVLLNLLQMDITYQLSVGVDALKNTLLVYGAIYLLLLVNSMFRIARAKPLELMKNDRVGEKAPKGNWFLALLGIICLGIAYYLAVTIKEPLSALLFFFVAVILVIAATYLLFIAGSVVFCRILKKNKGYYYKTNHFISVSSMVYRMKRNGAGLASICILLTMVLVMISASASLYFGAEDSLRSRYPKGVNISVRFDDINGISDENIETLYSAVTQTCGNQTELKDWRVGEIPGLFTDKGITVNYNSSIDFSLASYDNIGYLSVTSLEDYNRMNGSSETLKDDECMLYCIRTQYTSATFAMENGKAYKVKKVLDTFIDDGEYNSLIVPTICIVVKDFNSFVEPVLSLKNNLGDPIMMFGWHCGFDMNTAEEEISATKAIRKSLNNLVAEEKLNIHSQIVESREANRIDFFQTYASLFFLGIMLSIVFLIAAVLIIYYKQISEGYEDQSRFQIMQKVGMTKKEIRKSINSQILTVFFLPLIFAGIHLAFSFPMVWKLLQLFNLRNLPLVIIVNLICFVIFGLFYALVYKITSGSYYAIVSGAKEN
ncbi:MAG: ABC transporter permease [Firmicutes bacterium]|nr:ABC transporter permease [Bacillota bacterium]